MGQETGLGHRHRKKNGQRKPSTTQPERSPRATWVKKSHFKRNMGIFVLLIFIVVVGFYSLAQSPAGASSQPLQIYSSAWKTAPLTDAITNENINLGQFSGKTIVLQFMATYCQFCLAEGRQLVGVQQSLSGNSQARDQVVIVSVDVDPNENLAQLKQYVQQNHFGAPQANPPWYFAKDTTGQLLQSIAGNVNFGSFIARTPMYFIDKQQSNSFLTMQRSLIQQANPASDILAVVDKLL